MKNAYIFTFWVLFTLTSSLANAKPVNPPHNLSEAKGSSSFMNGVAGNTPFAFMENKGQVCDYDGFPHQEVKFVLQQGAMQLFLLEKGIAYQFTNVHYPAGYKELETSQAQPGINGQMADLQKRIRHETFRMDMTLAGANPHAAITTEGKSPDYSNYYNHHLTNVYSYNKIVYHNVYPGIDWVIYTSDKGIKYDFVVKPGGDPSLIQLNFNHQEALWLNTDRSITLKCRLGNITEQAPVSFQEGKEIKSDFILEGSSVSFKLGSYDHNKNLVIDPTLGWATYYGGTVSDYGRCSAVDASGNIYLGGKTESGMFIASGGYQNTYGGNSDAFLVKFNSLGVRLWATYYGGSGFEDGTGVTVDSNGNVFVCGDTYSGSGIASGGHQNVSGGSGDAFLLKFNSAGALQWGTYYGGASADGGAKCITDNSGNVYMVGYTASTSSISSSGHQNTFAGGLFDAFLVKFDGSGVRQWATYYGGLAEDYGLGCSVDGAGDIYLSGRTASGSGIASSGHQNAYGGGSSDAFLVKFNNSGVRQWGTYYGGPGEDHGIICATDISNNVYLSGSSNSTSGISSAGWQNTFGGGMYDAMLIKFNAAGVRLWATYLGGAGMDMGMSVSTNLNGDVYFGGLTDSGNAIAVGAFQNTPGGNGDCFISEFNGAGSLQWSSYYGGSMTDQLYSCSNDGTGVVYIAGWTSSTQNIATLGHQTFLGGWEDAFLARICSPPPPPSVISGNIVVCPFLIQTYSVSPDPSAISYNWLFPSGWGGSSLTNLIQIQPGASGQITVSAVNSCTNSTPQTLSVTVLPSPTVVVTNAQICKGDSYTITPSGAVNYTYSSGSAVVNPSVNTTYYVTGGDALGCVGNASLAITVKPLPIVSINGTVSSICEGENIILGASGADTYTWNGNVNGASLSVSPTITTAYSVTGTSSDGCENTAIAIQVVDACLGIQQVQANKPRVVIYPNPNNGVFVIETLQYCEAVVVNTLGQVVMQLVLTEGKNKVDMDFEPKGVYIITLLTEAGVNGIKLIKE